LPLQHHPNIYVIMYVQKIGNYHNYYMCVYMCARRRREYGLLEEPVMTISDADVDAVIRDMRNINPHVGVSLITGRLRSLGYHVTRERIRQLLQSSDPLRWPGAITYRRPYSVAGPNSLWHIGMFHVHIVIIATGLLWCLSCPNTDYCECSSCNRDTQ